MNNTLFYKLKSYKDMMVTNLYNGSIIIEYIINFYEEINNTYAEDLKNIFCESLIPKKKGYYFGIFLVDISYFFIDGKLN